MINERPRMLSELLFNEKRAKVLQFLLDESEKEYSIVDLAENTGLSRQFISEFTEDLSELGVVDRKKKGNMYLISANKDSVFYPPLIQILSIDSKPLKEAAKSFAEEISRSYIDVKSVILYGSVAKGVPLPSSDIDVLIVHETEEIENFREKINAEAEGLNKELRVNISPSYYGKKEFLTDLKAKRAYVENIVDEGEVLAGEKFWQKN